KEAVPFDYRNANIYFVMVDRFNNADTSNDNSYGRKKDGKEEIGTFHGGDLSGLTKKLDYIESLGVNAIWITSPLEQIHGWVGGGDKGDFKHYGYHGYYHQDWTKL
ncbi:alpha-amylase family glycosyl hydrolase, partial [Escherichia coli]|nr:alpha-amylase family glycosyl hydrolase [Escherichia coli]